MASSSRLEITHRSSNAGSDSPDVMDGTETSVRVTAATVRAAFASSVRMACRHQRWKTLKYQQLTVSHFVATRWRPVGRTRQLILVWRIAGDEDGSPMKPFVFCDRLHRVVWSCWGAERRFDGIAQRGQQGGSASRNQNLCRGMSVP